MSFNNTLLINVYTVIISSKALTFDKGPTGKSRSRVDFSIAKARSNCSY